MEGSVELTGLIYFGLLASVHFPSIPLLPCLLEFDDCLRTRGHLPALSNFLLFLDCTPCPNPFSAEPSGACGPDVSWLPSCSCSSGSTLFGISSDYQRPCPSHSSPRYSSGCWVLDPFTWNSECHLDTFPPDLKYFPGSSGVWGDEGWRYLQWVRKSLQESQCSRR